MSLPTTLPFVQPRALISDAMPGDSIPGFWMVAAAVVSLVAVALLMVHAALTIDPRAPSTLAFAAAFALAVGVRYVMRAPMTHLQRVARDIAESFGLFMLIALLGAVATYPLTAGSHGYADPVLERIDVMLRFNWIAWYDLVSDHRSLQLLGTVAYQSIFATPAVLLGVFAWENRQADARRFIAAFWVAAVLSLLLFRFMPAVGPLAFLWHGPIPYMPESALYQADLIPLLRDNMLHRVDLGTLRGLVSAPSFHTASAVLYIAAAWPVARLRWPVAVVNVAMLLSTPVEGTHYLTDMIAGAIVAVAALGIIAALRYHRRVRIQAASTAISAASPYFGLPR